jgi:hypothetical protein
MNIGYAYAGLNQEESAGAGGGKTEQTEVASRYPEGIVWFLYVYV